MNGLDAIYAGLAVVTAPWWARKLRHGWPERFGKSPPLPPPRVDDAGKPLPRILIHAVSVGEVHAIRELVPLLTPHVEVIVCATTDTGLARARELFANTAHIIRYPLDFSWAVNRFFDNVRPSVVALVELELWPNFVRACRHRGIPCGVINGRLSERSLKGYKRIHRWISPTFAGLDFTAVQDEDYAKRFRAMGSRDVAITGSMKWDAARIRDAVPGADQLAEELGIDRTRPLIVAGSTAEDEESLLNSACPPGVQLLCAPRKPEHFDEAARDLPGCTRRSHRTAKAGDRFLLDTIGELGRAYALADVVVIGRSFGELYGSDPLEPAALGKPVVAGPAMGDFASIVTALEESGGIVRATRANIGEVLARLMRDTGERTALGERARGCIRANQGASRRHADILLARIARS